MGLASWTKESWGRSYWPNGPGSFFPLGLKLLATVGAKGVVPPLQGDGFLALVAQPHGGLLNISREPPAERGFRPYGVIVSQEHYSITRGTLKWWFSR